ncbi:MAG: Bax inhibitor-1/YccA family protein [Proteobacteria bacterium]|nr:Bax inhibitor-1/YccA family protein [Pseudomonadota bacterium]
MFSKTTAATSYNAALARFLKTVFNYMSGGVALSGLAAYVTLHSNLIHIVANPAFQMGFIIVWFGFGFFANKIISKVSNTTGLLMFVGFSIITGMALSPIVAQYTASSITTAFFVTSAIFAGMSVFGISSKKSLSGWGSFLSMMSIGLIAAIVINIVLSLFGVNTAGFSMVISFLIVPLISAGVAYELNMLKETFSQYGHNEEMAAKVAIMSAVSLYTSFVVLFLHILRILGFVGGSD